MKTGYVYMISNKNRSLLYIGVTENLKRRITQHKNSNGAKFAIKYNLTYLLYFETFTNISEAIRREKQLKNWHKDWKWNLVKEKNPELRDLYLEIV